MSRKKGRKENIVLKIRKPIPKPSRPISSKKGAKGYNRKKYKAMIKDE